MGKFHRGNLNSHRRIYRDLNSLKILGNTEVLAQRVLNQQIRNNANHLTELNIMIQNVDNNVVRAENKKFTQALTAVVAELDSIDTQINECKTKMAHVKSQIDRANRALEKYTTINVHFSTEKQIDTLKDRLQHRNQIVNILKLRGTELKYVVVDLLFWRRNFQISRDDVIAKLKIRKREIYELVDHYTIAFSNGMKDCLNLGVCHMKSAKLLKENLQEMRQLIRAAESNDILRDIMITKASRIKLNSNAVPQRDMLLKNYEELLKLCEDQLTQINQFSRDMTPADLDFKRRQIFSVYLYENEITENIETAANNVSILQGDIVLSHKRITVREHNTCHLKQLTTIMDEGNCQINKQIDHLEKMKQMFRKYLGRLYDIYQLLKCNTEFGYEGSTRVDQFNLNEVLEFIEMRVRKVMYSVYCWQKYNADDEDKVIHGIEFVKPRSRQEIELINPCPECSQAEARANVDVEMIIDAPSQLAKLKEGIKNRSLASKIHHIEDCQKPGSKAIQSKHL